MKIAEVDDGQECWRVPLDNLIDALTEMGWTRNGNRWTEPPADAENLEIPYADLCSHLGGSVVDDDGAEPAALFTLRPDWGGDWELEYAL